VLKQNSRTSVADQISLQSWLRPELTSVGANKDFHEFRTQLRLLNTLLEKSHLESMAMDFALTGFENASGKTKRSRIQFSIKALRLESLRMMMGNPSYRTFSRAVASSDMLADFCCARRIDGIRGISKSTIDRASKFFTPEQLRSMMQVVIEMAGEADRCRDLGLIKPIRTDVCLLDTTCLEANIHFPVDWVLLRDVATTLLKAIQVIRTLGLCQRMPEDPTVFARKMSRLCIQMTHTRRKQDASKSRKAVLRKMKPLLKAIGEHAKRHRDRLLRDYASTSCSEAQAKRIIARIDGMLEQIPAVIRQAHERIIGERLVPSNEKIISVYEPDIHVIVRGKSGCEVEFGNTLLLAESSQGLILDWEFFQHRAPSESKQLEESIRRQNAYDLSSRIKATCTDRGFSSKISSEYLAELDIYDALCPKNPDELRRRMKEPTFAELQKRRASTEARIAILKQRQAKRLRNKGFNNRHRAVAWSILGHNLWIIARLLAKEEKERIAA
jgi:hypothetical protein